jgi:hypothetical protein
MPRYFLLLKSGRTSWAGHIVHLREMRTYNILIKNCEDSKSRGRSMHAQENNTECLLDKEYVNLWTDCDLARILSSGELF